MITIESLYTPTKNALAIHPNFGWQTCRDVFASQFYEITEHLYYAAGDSAEKDKVLEFIGKIEEKLKLKDKTKFESVVITKADGTKTADVLKVSVPKFWSSDSDRRSLFTLLLRNGSFYDSKLSLEENMDAYILSNQSKPSIIRFLNGYTISLGTPCAGASGWTHKYMGKPESKLKWTLVRPRYFWLVYRRWSKYKAQIGRLFLTTWSILIALFVFTLLIRLF